MPSLHISNVSYALLERQRVTLATITSDQLNKEQMRALEGIQNMLDTWSDEEYFIRKSGFRKEYYPNIEDIPGGISDD